MSGFDSPPTTGLDDYSLPDFPFPAEEDILSSFTSPQPDANAAAPSAAGTKRAAPSSPDNDARPFVSADSRNDTDDFGTSSLHFGPRTGADGADDSRAGSADSLSGPGGPNKRLRRGPAESSSGMDSFLNSPADSSGAQTPGNGPQTLKAEESADSGMLRDHLARFKVDSQPGSSSSSVYGGGDSQSQPVVAPGYMARISSGGAGPAKTEEESQEATQEDGSSPVQRTGGGARLIRGVKPVIPDSPSSTIDLRSSPTLPKNSAQLPPTGGMPYPNATGPSPSYAPQIFNAPPGAFGTPPVPQASPSLGPPPPPPTSGLPAGMSRQQADQAFAQFCQMTGSNFSPERKRDAFIQANGDTMNAISLLVQGPPSTSQSMQQNAQQQQQQQQQSMYSHRSPSASSNSPSMMGGQLPPHGQQSGIPRQPTILQQQRPMQPPPGTGQFYASAQGPGRQMPGQMQPGSQPYMQQPPSGAPRLQIIAIPLQPGQGPEHQLFTIQGRPDLRLTGQQIAAYQAQFQQRQAQAQAQVQAGQYPPSQMHPSQMLPGTQQQRVQNGPSPVRIVGGGRGGFQVPTPQQLNMISSQATNEFRRQLESSGRLASFSSQLKDHQTLAYHNWLQNHPKQAFQYLLTQLPPLPPGTRLPPPMNQGQFRVNQGQGVYRQPTASGSGPYQQPRPMSLHERTLAALPQGNRKKKKKKQQNSDSDGDGGDWSDGGSGDEFEAETPAQLQRRELLAVEWFNTCTKDELCELAGCNQTQASLTIKLRPFQSPNDFRTRTRKQKGVGNQMMETYLEVIAGMHEIDKVLSDCEAIGRELSRIMNIWATGASAGGEAPTGTAGAPPVEQAADVGINLVAMSAQAVEEKSRVNPEVAEAFKNYIREQPEGVPSTITLKDYQMLGLNWLNLLYRRGTSCILADDMGLGKTAQVISLISHLKSTGEPGPHLIIVPSSTLENWMREFSVFAPALHVESYYGSQYERAEIRHELRNMEDLDVVVTTYNIATSSADDQKFLKRKMDFKICVFDEGHQLKNSQSKKYKDLMQIRAQWRLLLTGTPLQNNLGELISLLSFILPDQFRDATDSLKAIFKVGPGSQANLLSTTRISRAKKMMTPFVLRRKKTQVLKDLPSKSERIEWCDMTPLQREVYNEAITRSKRALMDVPEEEIEELAEDADGEDGEAGVAPKGRKKKAPALAATKTGNKSDANSSSNVLMDLRKASNHPMLFRRLYNDKTLRLMARECLKEDEFLDRDKDLIYEDMEVMTDFELHRFCLPYKHLNKFALKNEEWMSAGKIAKLKELLPGLKANGDRVLLFSQFTQILDILEVVLGTMGMKYLKLTGQTSVTERQGLVDQYTNDPDITVFLLSTRAGGLGLNLVAANHVIFYDLDYNPHNDKQAEDRSFRIGQNRDVTIIKLITRDSLDEEIHHLAAAKLQLDASISANPNAASSSSAPTNTGEGDEGASGNGNAGQVEKKMRTSLLSNLKKRFEAESQQTQSQA